MHVRAQRTASAGVGPTCGLCRTTVAKQANANTFGSSDLQWMTAPAEAHNPKAARMAAAAAAAVEGLGEAAAGVPAAGSAAQ